MPSVHVKWVGANKDTIGDIGVRFYQTVLAGGLYLLTGSVLAEPFDDAITAYEQGDYQAAETVFRVLAEQSHSGAETMLGVMYFHGRGVEENKAHAAIWFYKASRKGNPNAQLAFGSLHIRGVGVRQNLVKAYEWLSLASLYGDDRIRGEAERLKSEISDLIPEEERQQISENIRDWRPVPSLE